MILEARLGAIRDIVGRRTAIGDERQVPVFSTDDAAPMWRNTLSGLIKEISDNMVKEGEARAPFQLRDIRRDHLGKPQSFQGCSLTPFEPRTRWCAEPTLRSPHLLDGKAASVEEMGNVPGQAERG